MSAAGGGIGGETGVREDSEFYRERGELSTGALGRVPDGEMALGGSIGYNRALFACNGRT